MFIEKRVVEVVDVEEEGVGVEDASFSIVESSGLRFQILSKSK